MTGRMASVRVIAGVLLVVLSACAEGEGDRDGDGGEPDVPVRTEAAGALFIETDGTKLCSAVAESYPPQCGGDRLFLLDLTPDAVVALMSPPDPTFAPVTWTDYTLGVTGIETDMGLTNVELVDPVYSNARGGLVLRVVDLGIHPGEPVLFPMDLTNTTDTPVELTFFDGQRAEVVFHDASGEAYRWSADRMFTQSIEAIVLEPGSTVPYVLTGEAINLPRGDYTATAWVTAKGAEDLVVVWSLRITAPG